MNHLPKEIFVTSLEALRQQIINDKISANLVSQAFPGSEISSYDNSLAITAVLTLLSIWFDLEDLQHYCFDLDFGKHHENGFMSLEDFYDSLVCDNEDSCLYCKKEFVGFSTGIIL